MKMNKLKKIVEVIFFPFWWWLLDKSPVEPTFMTQNIVILGSKGSGKTTLWNQLRGRITDTKYTPTGYDNINCFIIRGPKNIVVVSSTKDLGGDDIWINLDYYEKLINRDGTFIYFLVDLTRLEETKREVRARIKKISTIINDKKLKNCGIKILATFYDKYRQNTLEPAITYITKILNLKPDNNSKVKLSDRILTVNLLDNNDIEIIKNEIINRKDYE